jgi:hypothetical protein
MSAAEIIALIDRLPPPEREVVRQHLESTRPPLAGEAAPRRIEISRGLAAGDAYFDRHPELFRKLAE